MSTLCEANRTGRQNELPVSEPKRKTVPLTHFVWIPIHEKSVGIRQIPAGEWWEGMWEFPRASSLAELERMLPDAWAQEIGHFRHSVTHHRIEVKVALVRLENQNSDLTWVEMEKLEDFALPSPQRKALAMALRMM